MAAVLSRLPGLAVWLAGPSVVIPSRGLAVSEGIVAQRCEYAARGLALLGLLAGQR